MVEYVPVITIDGPSGSGKGTISLLLAKFLRWHLLDSGALYRVLALATKQHGVEVSTKNKEALVILATHLDVQFEMKTKDASAHVILEGSDVTHAIRTPECTNTASVIAAYPEVREALLERQRAFRELPGLIADGRDMGSIVFPDADFKVFLNASVEARANRRHLQLQEQGISVSLARVLSELNMRDKRDTERVVAPLKPASDAWILDTTFLSIDEAFARIMDEVLKRIPLLHGESLK